MFLMDKLRAKAVVSRVTKEEVSEIGKLLANLAWFETKDAALTFAADGNVYASVYGIRDGKRIRLAEGVGETMTLAMEEVAAILRSQDDSDATGTK